MEAAIIVFLLFFAVLAFGWFYVQRAKSRDAAHSPEPSAPDSTDSPAS